MALRYVFYALLSVCSVVCGSPALAAPAVGLTCDIQGASADALCAAMRHVIAEPDAVIGEGDEGVGLVLVVRSPNARVLQAQLDVVIAGRRQVGRPSEIGVSDSGKIPTESLRRFALYLIENAINDHQPSVR